MLNPEDFQKYYSLENYLPLVREKFKTQHYLSAFDFFCIIIWKSNRAKSIVAQGITDNHTKSTDVAVKEITTKLKEYENNQQKQLEYLLSFKGINLPMASAILAILYPQTFSIYDYRACETLTVFSNLKNLDKTKGNQKRKLIEGYFKYLAAVKEMPGKNLKEKDEWLWGKSFYNSLQQEIKNKFKKSDNK